MGFDHGLPNLSRLPLVSFKSFPNGSKWLRLLGLSAVSDSVLAGPALPGLQ